MTDSDRPDDGPVHVSVVLAEVLENLELEWIMPPFDPAASASLNARSEAAAFLRHYAEKAGTGPALSLEAAFRRWAVRYDRHEAARVWAEVGRANLQRQNENA